MRLNERLYYEALAKWDHETGGKVTTDGFTISYDTPENYGGLNRHPCPDQLFLASISGCLMNTFLYYKNHLDIETKDISVSSSAKIDLVNPFGYRIKEINAMIHVQCSSDEAEMNRTCAERAREFCHLTRSIENAIPLNVEIIVEEDS